MKYRTRIYYSEADKAAMNVIQYALSPLNLSFRHALSTKNSLPCLATPGLAGPRHA